MLVQKRAFQAYYGSMTDGELLATAANRSSFIELAQQTLDEELAKRNLEAPAALASVQTPPAGLRAAVDRWLHRHKGARS